MKKRYFPCQYCKGTGIAESGDFVDGQQVSADLECGNCKGEGLIEIGGKIHWSIRHLKLVARLYGRQIKR